MPVCFMIMPYGTRETQAPAGKGPAKVSFDALWEKAFAPVIAGLGYEPIRADQDLGALIIQEMLERLALSDLVIADMTVPNGNVYYEVGVRHAARERGCVLIGADWSRPLFDVDQLRRVPYPLPEGEITDETAAAVRAALGDAVRKLADGRSPLWEAIPGFPDQIDPKKLNTFADVVRELSDFQGEVMAARRAPGAERKGRALALRDRHLGMPVLGPAMALELLFLLRDAADWQTVIDFVDRLPPRLREVPLVQEQRALALSKAGDHLEAIAALEALIALSGDSSERQGLLGGRYKKLYLASSGPDRARYLDLAIEHYDRGMRLDLNDYFPSSNLARLLRARAEAGDEERAAAAAHIALAGCERARSRDPKDSWIRPTLLGAAFDAGDIQAAERLAVELRREGPAAWKLDTTLKDLEQSVSLTPQPEKRQSLEKIIESLRQLL
jgi:tetratricopeptide (TPR) repeat protein